MCTITRKRSDPSSKLVSITYQSEPNDAPPRRSDMMYAPSIHLVVIGETSLLEFGVNEVRSDLGRLLLGFAGGRLGAATRSTLVTLGWAGVGRDCRLIGDGSGDRIREKGVWPDRRADNSLDLAIVACLARHFPFLTLALGTRDRLVGKVESFKDLFLVELVQARFGAGFVSELVDGSFVGHCGAFSMGVM